MTRIRPMTDADIDAVALVHTRTWQAGYAGIIPADYLASLDPSVFASRRRSQAARPGAQTLVAEDDGRVVGFAAFGPYRGDHGQIDFDMGELYAIYVSPEHWGHGTGRELIDAAKTALTAAGFPDMRLWVLEENANARRFYERMGLRPDGTRQTYTPHGTTAELPELRYATPL